MTDVSAVHPVAQLRQYDARFQALPRALPGGELESGVLWRAIGFRIGRFHLAASMDQVREVLTDPLVSRVPGAKPWVRGLANVRGRLVTIVDMPQFLRIERAADARGARALFVDMGDLDVGLLVDQVFGARQFPETDRAEGPGDAPDTLRAYVSSRITGGADTWYVLDIARLVADPAFLNAAA